MVHQLLKILLTYEKNIENIMVYFWIFFFFKCFNNLLKRKIKQQLSKLIAIQLTSTDHPCLFYVA